MPLLKLCRKFLYMFTSNPLNYRLNIIEKFLLNSRCRRGYVYSIQDASYCESKIKAHPLVCNIVDVNNGSNVSDKNINNNNKTITSEALQNYLSMLTTGFEDMRVDSDVLIKTLEIYAALSENIDISIDVFLLNCCGEVLPDVNHQIRKDLTRHTWKLIKDKNSQLSLIHYHTFLIVCAQNDMKIEPVPFINGMDVTPDENTYKHLLQLVGKVGDFNDVNYVLSKIKEMKYSLTHEGLYTLMKFYARNRDKDSIDIIINTTNPSTFGINNEFYGNLAVTYAILGEMDNILKLLKSHSIDSQYVLQIIKTMSSSANRNDIHKLLMYLPEQQVVTKPLLYNIIIELVYLRRLNDVWTIMDYFHEHCNSKATFDLTKHYLKALVRVKLPVQIILQEGKKYNELYTSTRISHILLEESLRSNYEDLSLLLFEDMKSKNIEIRPHYYWPLLVQSAKRGETKIHEIVRHMIHMSVCIDYDTLLHYIIPHISTSSQLAITLKKLTNNGIPISNIITPLMSYFLENGELEKSMELSESMLYQSHLDFIKILSSMIIAYQITRNADACTKILKNIIKNNKDYASLFLLQLIGHKPFKRDIIAVLKEFVNMYAKYGLHIFDAHAEILLEKLSENQADASKFIKPVSFAQIISEDSTHKMSYSRFLEIPHPKDMNLEELEYHLIELKSKGLNCRGVLRKLFLIYSKKNDVERLLNIKQQFDKFKMPLSTGMKAALFKLYAQTGDIDEFSKILLDLQQNHPNFKIDLDKVLDAATALVNHNEVKMALNIISNKYGKVGFNLSHKCWKFLNAIAHSEYSQLTDSAFHLLIKNNVIDCNTQILGPLVRQHLLKNDIQSAVAVFKMCAAKYKKTPLRQELVCILINDGNNTSAENSETKSMLRDVLDIIQKIHGKNTVLMDLTIGYAQYRMLIELRECLMNFETINIPINQMFAAIQDEIKLPILQTILDASYGMIFIDRHEICESILSLHCQAGNYEDAIKLWERMNDEKIIPSLSFKKVFSDLLLKHKVEIPNNFKTEFI